MRQTRALFDQTDAPRHCDAPAWRARKRASGDRRRPAIAGLLSPDQVPRSSQGRFSAIEIVREKRNFDAAAPHWLSA
jgi:hypothetical protein